MTVWVSRLLTAVGRDSLELDVDWGSAERDLGLTVPADYKDLCGAFGVGEFSDFLNLLPPDPTGTFDLVSFWRDSLDMSREWGFPKGQDPTFKPFDPYEVGAGGVLTWGTSRTRTLFSWLVPTSASSDWPILVHYEDGPDGRRFEMPTSEFVFRVLTEPDFTLDGIAGMIPQPYFRTASELFIPGFG